MYSETIQTIISTNRVAKFNLEDDLFRWREESILIDINLNEFIGIQVNWNNCSSI